MNCSYVLPWTFIFKIFWIEKIHEQITEAIFYFLFSLRHRNKQRGFPFFFFASLYFSFDIQVFIQVFVKILPTKRGISTRSFYISSDRFYYLFCSRRKLCYFSRERFESFYVLTYLTKWQKFPVLEKVGSVLCKIGRGESNYHCEVWFIFALVEL